jgi:cytoskeletal protein RodZ
MIGNAEERMERMKTILWLIAILLLLVLLNVGLFGWEVLRYMIASA